MDRNGDEVRESSLLPEVEVSVKSYSILKHQNPCNNATVDKRAPADTERFTRNESYNNILNYGVPYGATKFMSFFKYCREIYLEDVKIIISGQRLVRPATEFGRFSLKLNTNIRFNICQ